MESDEAVALSVASGDFDEDGVPDLVSGYLYADRGLITLWRGNIDAVYPNSPQAKRRRASESFTEAPFLSPAQVFSAPVAVDFLAAGDFDADGHWDVVAGASTAKALYLFAGNGHGEFSQPRELEMPGRLTALVAGEINRRDGLMDLALVTEGNTGAQAIVLESPQGAFNATPEVFGLRAPASALALGQFDGEHPIDLLVASEARLLLIRGRDQKLAMPYSQQGGVPPARMSSRVMDAPMSSLSTADFDGDSLIDVALLTRDGAVKLLLQNPSNQPPPESAGELNGWKLQSLPLSEVFSGVLTAATVSSSGSTDLVVVPSVTNSLHVMPSPGKPAKTGALTLTSERPAVAVLPMRLDVDALTDLVVLQNGASAPSIIFTAASAKPKDDHNTPESVTFSNANPINITGTSPPPSVASPYPSTITVSGQPATLDKVRVKLNKLNHNLPFALDIVLVGPTGQKVILMSSAGLNSVSNIDLAFDDEAGGYVPTDMISGTYKPTNPDGDIDEFPAPGPAGPFQEVLSAFNGTNPNGVWSLYLVDDRGFSFSTGNIAEGWNLIIGADPHPPLNAVVVNTNSSGPGSLRQAILDTNASVGADLITFNIPGNGIQTIRPLSLYVITDAVTIDGTTQPGFAGTPVIELDGGAVSLGPRGFIDVRTGGCRIRGLILNRFNGSGFRLQAGDGNIIEGNYIGTNAAGTAKSVPDFGRGIDIYDYSSNNLIGGTTPESRNLISGNNTGVDLSGNGSTGQRVEGNFIGTDVTGTLAVENSFGVKVFATGNTVGGTTAGTRNIISGNEFQGLQLYGDGNLVQGNFIGTNATGTAALGNGFFGIDVSRGTSNNTMGGTTVAARNLISGNSFGGISIGHPDFPEVNFNNLIQGNYIGTDLTGTANLGNIGDGVQVPNSAEGGGVRDNLLAFNTTAGVNIFNTTRFGFTPGIKIAIIDNAIFSNGAIGIDLGTSGITPNDNQDVDVGPNLLQNFPVLNSFAQSPPSDEFGSGSSLEPEASVNVNATLNSTPNTTFTIHWYFSADAQCVTNQAASRPLVTGRVPNVVTNANGNASFGFSLEFPVGINNGIVNSTATDPQGNTSEFSSCLAVSSGPPASPTPTPLIQFDAANYPTTESAGSRTITVTRTGGSAAPASVRYLTSDAAGSNNCGTLNTGLASSRCDYQAVLGTLSFAAGETSKIILVPIIDDSYGEGNERLTLTLSNPTGAGLGTPSTANLVINDNESINGPTPIDGAAFFVRTQYIDFLNREPDASGLAFWTNEITSCGTNPGCIEIKRINVSGAFFLSIEFQETGYLVYRVYKVAYNPPGSPVPIRFAEFLEDTQQIGKGVIVGEPDWQAKLEANKNAYLFVVVQRQRFANEYATSMTPAQFVDKLFLNAGVTPSAIERSSIISEFGGSSTTADINARARALGRVAQNSALAQLEYNRAFVLMQYFGYLRRNPDDPPEANLNFDGYNFWLGKLNQFNGNYIAAEMVKAFISSIEYRARFGP